MNKEECRILKNYTKNKLAEAKQVGKEIDYSKSVAADAIHERGEQIIHEMKFNNEIMMKMDDLERKKEMDLAQEVLRASQEGDIEIIKMLSLKL